MHIDARVDNRCYGASMLVEALRAKGWSHREAGREVLAGWKKRERRDRYPEPDAIAVKIGLLVRGDATWWLNHPKALETLADLLHVKPDDLLPRGTKRRPAQIELAEFAEVAGLLPGQAPCAVNPDGWLGTYVDTALERGGLWWFVVPPGGGKSLAIRALDRLGASDVVTTTTRTLFEAARQTRDGSRLVVEVDYADPASDTSAIAELSRRTEATCVLAAFDRPGPTASDGWNAVSFALHRNWREQLVGWLRSRVPVPDRLDSDAILSWIDSVDPAGTVFSSPGDLVSIVARIYRSGIPDRPIGLGDLTTEWLSQTMTASSDTWLRRFGRDAVEQLSGERARRLDLAHEPLSAATWASFLPDDLLRPQAKTTRGKRGKSIKRDDDADEASTNARDVVHVLADAGVLRSTQSGDLDVFPNWVRVGLDRALIQEAVRSGDVTRWGLWANDSSRRDSVDDALDAMGPSDLVRAAAKIDRDDDLASIAATEALFSAFARRFAITAWRPSGEAIAIVQALGRTQLRLLDRNAALGAPSPSIPLTRYRSDGGRVDEAIWWSEAWTFSFAVAAPITIAPDSAWRLPGWAQDLRLADAPSLSHLIGYSQNQAPTDDPWTLGILRSARPAVRACRDVDMPDDIDLCLLIWVVIDGPSRGWQIGKQLASSLVGSRVLDFVRELLVREPEAVCASAVAEVWRALLQLDAYANPMYVLRMLRDGHRAFFDLLAAHLPLDGFTAAFASVDLLHTPDLLTALLPELPDRLSRLVIRMIADQARTSKKPIWNLDAAIVTSFGHDQIDVLVDLTQERYAVGAAAAQRVWRLDPTRSIDEALTALRAGAESARTWFGAAPPVYLPQMLDAIGELDDRPAWVQRWLVTMLARAGTHAERVFEMMERPIASRR